MNCKQHVKFFSLIYELHRARTVFLWTNEFPRARKVFLSDIMFHFLTRDTSLIIIITKTGILQFYKFLFVCHGFYAIPTVFWLS